MEFFHDLGSLVEQRWRDESYNEEIFPEVAATCLAEMQPSSNVDPWDIIRWVNRTPDLPQQRDVAGAFGNPPITLFNGPRFYIDVYYWLDGTTSIHQHAFCGAFQVLKGSSILSRYDFEEERRINAHFLIGKMVLNTVELLAQGDIRRILPGKEYIHSLFHLDRPSVSIVIRTHQSPSGLPQYNYVKPCFAVDPFFSEQTMIKRVQSAALLLNMKHPEADQLIGELLSGSDFHTAFSILDLAFNALNHDQFEGTFGLTTGKQRFDALLDIGRRRHHKLADLLPQVFDEAQRQQNLILRRGQITSNEHRFLLALLLNVPDRARILELVSQRFPDRNPVDTVIDWVEELANTKLAGSSEPNVLGILDFDEDYLFVLQCLFEGLALEDMKRAFEKEFSEEYDASNSEKLERLYATIASSILFKSIFAVATSASAPQTAVYAEN